MIVSNYIMSPSVIAPGGRFKLDLTLKNVSGTDVEDISVSAVEASGAIAAVESGNTKYIEELGSGDSERISFSMISEASAASKMLVLDIALAYEDEAGVAVVVGTGSVKYLSSSGSGSKSKVAFELASGASLSSGIYNFPINFSYVDSKGNIKASSQAKASLPQGSQILP
ncbi:MAG: hypothetical protein QMD53_02090 [Actinomycetota bacterium]|nr:hypothetical protein [Actinomycetota bacterium]